MVKRKARVERAKKAQTSAKNDVEKRWSEYWRLRKELEDAVAKVRTAREGLSKAMELERGRCAQFEQVKAALTKLLDVEPAAAPRPVPLATEPRGNVS